MPEEAAERLRQLDPQVSPSIAGQVTPPVTQEPSQAAGYPAGPSSEIKGSELKRKIEPGS
jgi:hypothetical protein